MSSHLKDARDHVGAAAGEVAAAVREQAMSAADSATAAAGGGLRSAAGALRDHTSHKGVVGSASGAVADAIDRGGRYLEREKLTGLVDDMITLASRHPCM